MKSFLIFKVDGSSHFGVCSLRPIQRASLHDHGHPDHRFASFCVQFVPTCSLTCSELPSMLLFTALHSFLAFRQRAAALPPSFHYIDPPALFFMLPCFLYSLETLESLPYILPCLSNLKTTVPSIGVFVIPFYICSFLFFYCLR